MLVVELWVYDGLEVVVEDVECDDCYVECDDWSGGYLLCLWEFGYFGFNCLFL